MTSKKCEDAVIETYKKHTPKVDPSAWIHKSAVVIGRVFIGADASVWPHVCLRGDEGKIVIGDQSNIQDGTIVHMTGGRSETVVGRRVTVGHKCILHGCTIEDDVLVGMGAIIMDNTRIGTGCLIGAGTLITADKEIPPHSLVFGNPMKIIRPTNERETDWIDYAWRHYVENSAAYKDVNL